MEWQRLVPPGVNTPLYSTRYPHRNRAWESSRRNRYAVDSQTRFQRKYQALYIDVFTPGGTRRFFNFPYEAIEEALSNAVYHKGYDERESVEVRMETDRIIIVSHPGADRSISTENLREYRAYCRRYRNRRIGEFLKEMHLTEGRNTGFRKIRNALKTNGSPEPLFETDDARTYFSSTIYIHPDFKNDGVNDGVKTVDLSVREIAVLDIIKGDPSLSAEKIALQLAVSRPTVERVIRTLKNKGILTRKGSAKTGEWIISLGK